MKKFFLFLISLFTTASVFAEPLLSSNLYIDAFGGINFVNSFKKKKFRIELNSGGAIGGALGYRFSRFFRLEAEVAYRSNSFDQMVVYDNEFPASGSIKKTTALANGVIEFPLRGSSLIPYCGFGFGERWDKERFALEPIITEEKILIFEGYKAKHHGSTYQGIAGLIFSVGHKMQAAVEYRYLDGSHMQGNHTVDLNLRKYF